MSNPGRDRCTRFCRDSALRRYSSESEGTRENHVQRPKVAHPESAIQLPVARDRASPWDVCWGNPWLCILSKSCGLNPQQSAATVRSPPLEVSQAVIKAWGLSGGRGCLKSSAAHLCGLWKGCYGPSSASGIGTEVELSPQAHPFVLGPRLPADDGKAGWWRFLLAQLLPLRMSPS